DQMTAVEGVAPANRYSISGSGYDLEGSVQHAAGAAASIEDAILPYIVASDAKLVDGKVVGDPTEGALLVLGHKAGLDIDGTREELPRLAILPFDPTYKLMATFCPAIDASGRQVVRCFVKGAAPAVMERATTPGGGGGAPPAGPDGPGVRGDAAAAGGGRGKRGRREGDGRRVRAPAPRDLAPPGFAPEGALFGYAPELQMPSLVGMVDPPR